jgi:hypothetical protein
MTAVKVARPAETDAPSRDFSQALWNSRSAPNGCLAVADRETRIAPDSRPIFRQEPRSIACVNGARPGVRCLAKLLGRPVQYDEVKITFVLGRLNVE